MGATITTETKLRIAFRFLATGDSLASLQHLYRVPKCAISTFLPQVLNTVYAALEEIIKVNFIYITLLHMEGGRLKHCPLHPSEQKEAKTFREFLLFGRKICNFVPSFPTPSPWKNGHATGLRQTSLLGRSV